MRKRKIKLLYSIPNFDTAGSGKAMLNIASRLDPAVFEPHIMCMHDRGAFFEKVKASGLPVHLREYTYPVTPRLKFLMRALQHSQFYRRNKFDIVHSFHYSSDYSEAAAARLGGCKWVFTKKNMSWGGAAANSWKLRSRLASSIMVQNTDMIEQFYPNSDKIKLVPRGVNADDFVPREPSEALLQELGLRGDEKVVLAVANLVPVKGIELLIQAFASIAETDRTAHLYIVGDDKNDYAKQLKAQASATACSARIKFMGKRSDVSDFQSIADIFVLPTLNEGRREGSPVSMLEAMSSGNYVIGSAVPGIKDQLIDYPSNLFDPGSATALTSRLEDAMQHSKTELSEKGRLFRGVVEDRFTIEREVADHEAFYLKVLGIER